MSENDRKVIQELKDWDLWCVGHGLVSCCLCLFVLKNIYFEIDSLLTV